MSGGSWLRRFWREARRLVRYPRWFWREHRHLVLAAGAVALVLLAGGGVLAYELAKRPADIRNPQATFQPQKPKAQKRKTVSWPLYGYDRARTRYLPAKGVRPPFQKVWRYTDRPLLLSLIHISEPTRPY